MHVVKRVVANPVRIGGDRHIGWLPAGAAEPLPTPVRDLLLNIEIVADGSGFLLCHSSSDGAFCGDTWHESLSDAERCAAESFGVRRDQWQDATGPAATDPST